MFLFTYNEDKRVMADRLVSDGPDVDGLPKMLAYVEGLLEDLSIPDSVGRYISVYFQNKFTGDRTGTEVGVLSLESVRQYRYYVNLVEWQLFQHFFEGKVFRNKVCDILDVLEHTGEIDFALRVFLDGLSPVQLTMFLYVLSSSTVKLPNKHILLKIDSNLSIYKRVRRGVSRQCVATEFKRGLTSVDSVCDLYSKIFSEV